jgi:hypothetical protein
MNVTWKYVVGYLARPISLLLIAQEHIRTMRRRGRPQQYADQVEGTRARVQRYRERQRAAALPAPPPSQFQNIFLAWDPRPQLTTVVPTDDPSNIFADLQEALEAVLPEDQEEIRLPEDNPEDDQGLEIEDIIMGSPARPNNKDGR